MKKEVVVENRINRLAIFSMYDKESIISSYKLYVIKELQSIANDLIVVVNVNLDFESEKKIRDFTENILYRENVGFDAGAYKEVLLEYVGEEKLKSYQEIVFCNDTFFGPLVSMKEIFEKMSSSPADFWGLNHVSGKILDYIESYFLVFRSEIILNEELPFYFRNYIDSKETDIANVYSSFEVGLFGYLRRKGYSFDTYTNCRNLRVYDFPDVCMEEYGLPIVKKKAFENQTNMENQTQSLKYILGNYHYDIQMILEEIERLYDTSYSVEEIQNFQQKKMDFVKKEGASIILDVETLTEFLEMNREIYIYGTGIFARKVYWECKRINITNFKGFVVSNIRETEKELYGYPVNQYRDIRQNISVILGLDVKNTKAVLLSIKENDKVLVLWNM